MLFFSFYLKKERDKPKKDVSSPPLLKPDKRVWQNMKRYIWSVF